MLQLCFKFLQHLFVEALLVGSGIENLQRGDFGFVLLDVGAEQSGKARGLFLRGGVEAGEFDLVDRDGVDGLLGVLFRLGEGVAEEGVVEGGTGGGDELLCSCLQ